MLIYALNLLVGIFLGLFIYLAIFGSWGGAIHASLMNIYFLKFQGFWMIIGSVKHAGNNNLVVSAFGGDYVY